MTKRIVLSPDGKRIAFLARTEMIGMFSCDNADVPANGGSHNMMRGGLGHGMVADGKEVIFETRGTRNLFHRLYKTSADRLALATALPLTKVIGLIVARRRHIAYNRRLAR